MLNHGSFGATPRTVLERQHEFQAQMEAEPVRFMIRELEGLWHEALDALASFLRTDADRLALVPNATTGANTVLRSLSFERDDEILLLDHAYNAVSNAAQYVADRAGCQLTWATLPLPIVSEDEVVTRIMEAVTPRTRLAVIDHITSPTGLVLPIEKIVASLKSQGVDTLVDGAHAPGHVELNLNALDAAYYIGNCHKWLCTPKGSAFLYVAPEKQHEIRPLTISHGANRSVPGRSRFRLEFDWTGTHDPTAFLTIPFALKQLAGWVDGGWAGIREHNRQLALYARRTLLDAVGGVPICPESMVGCLAAIQLPDDPTGGSMGPIVAIDPLQEALFSQWQIEVPVVPWPSAPHRLLRTASQLYNSKAQVDYLADALRDLGISLK